MPQTWDIRRNFYTWRKKYGGMEVSEAKQLKALVEENARLKKLLSTLREILAMGAGERHAFE